MPIRHAQEACCWTVVCGNRLAQYSIDTWCTRHQLGLLTDHTMLTAGAYVSLGRRRAKAAADDEDPIAVEAAER